MYCRRIKPFHGTAIFIQPSIYLPLPHHHQVQSCTTAVGLNWRWNRNNGDMTHGTWLHVDMAEGVRVDLNGWWLIAGKRNGGSASALGNQRWTNICCAVLRNWCWWRCLIGHLSSYGRWASWGGAGIWRCKHRCGSIQSSVNGGSE